MQCASLKLQERSKATRKQNTRKTNERPRRYCQQRLVNPKLEEDPTWSDVLDRFHCHLSFEDDNEDAHDIYPGTITQHQRDLYLTVQNLKFLGNPHQIKRPTTSFKYKTITDGRMHRMFVKQMVENAGLDADQESQFTCYYLEDYDKYTRRERSAPSSTRSTDSLLQVLNENKAVQTENTKPIGKKKVKNEQVKKDVTQTSNTKVDHEKEAKDCMILDDTKIAYHKSGKRKSLTLSRAQSPETVQVIRVEVVCNNYSSSSIVSETEEKNKSDQDIVSSARNKKQEGFIKNCFYANKYLLTNAYKPLDENVSGGTKVTLLCKTFRLLDRSIRLSEIANQSRLDVISKKVNK